MSRRIDRTTPPVPAPLTYVPLPDIEQYTLPNGIAVYAIRYGTQEVVECQMVFPSGHCYEPHMGLSAFSGKLLTDGTPTRSSLQLAQQLDDFGASIQAESGYELTTVTLSTLERHLPLTLNLLKDVVLNASYPQEEFATEQARTLQRLQVQQQKTQYQARVRFAQHIYGPGHPYAANPSPQDIQALTADMCRDYAREFFHPTRATLIVAGLFEPADMRKLLEDKLGSIPVPAVQPPLPHSLAKTQPLNAAPAGQYVHPMPGNVQASLRVGHPGLPRNHADHNGMRLVNTLLGGFFGSRLMKNIREEKGYTYGIHSQWAAMRHAGMFVIGTDVGNAFVTDTLHQISLEMTRLCEEKVPEEELSVARNYLLGKLVSNQETPFQIADLVKALLLHEMPLDTLTHSFEEIAALDADKLLHLAQTHLKPQELRVVIAGEV